MRTLPVQAACSLLAAGILAAGAAGTFAQAPAVRPPGVAHHGAPVDSQPFVGAGAPAAKPGASTATGNGTKPFRAATAGALIGHGGPIKTVRVDATGTLALTGSFDYAMAVWDLTADPPKRLHHLADHNGAVNAVAFLPDGKRALAGTDDGAVALWDIESGKLLHRFTGHRNKVVGLAVSDDGRTAVSSSWDRTARLWDLTTLTAGPVLSGHTGPVNAAQFSPDGTQVYTASYDGSIGVWARGDGSFKRPLYKHGWGINALERVPAARPGDPLRLAYGALNGSAGIVSTAEGSEPVLVKEHPRPVLALAVIEKPGLVATGGGDGVIRVSRLDDGAVIEEFQNPFGPVWALAFTTGGAGLYYGGLDDFASLWQVSPRLPFEAVASQFPRRFQVAEADADDPVAQGRLQFARKCSVCHTLTPDGGNRAGPTLHKIFGRRIGTLPGYPYSPSLKQLDIVWSAETVSKLFELGPDVFTPGSKMPLQKMSDPKQRDALIAYMRQATIADAAAKP